MKRVSIWSLVIVLALLLYLVFTWLFATLFQEMSVRQPTHTPIFVPTFTPTLTVTPIVIAQLTATAPQPTSPPTPSPPPTDAPTATPTLTATASPTPTQVVAATAVNIRLGPGTNYPVIGVLQPGDPQQIVGQNSEESWWQIRQTDGTTGWVAGAVVEASHAGAIPVVPALPPPQPTATPVPPTATRPPHQFTPTGWYDDTNYGLTRFLGSITDVNGNPVNGVTVEAQCGTYRIISNPSGPVGGFATNDSADDPPGFYDITIEKRPVPCQWQLTVVYTEDGKTTLAKLSETIEVEVTVDKSIIVANWRKNW